MKKKPEGKNRKKPSATKDRSAKLVKKAETQAMAGGGGPTPSARFTSSRMYEMRIADTLDVKRGRDSSTPIRDHFEPKPASGSAKYHSARVEVPAGRFVVVHVDHAQHIVYFVTTSDDLRAISSEGGPQGSE